MAMLEAEVVDLRQRITRVEEQLARLVGPDPGAPESALRRAVRRAGYEVVDSEAIRPSLRNAFAKMGILHVDPTLTPQRLRERMRQRGLRPEDRVFNSTREEMREEDEA